MAEMLRRIPEAIQKNSTAITSATMSLGLGELLANGDFKGALIGGTVGFAAGKLIDRERDKVHKNQKIGYTERFGWGFTFGSVGLGLAVLAGDHAFSNQAVLTLTLLSAELGFLGTSIPAASSSEIATNQE